MTQVPHFEQVNAKVVKAGVQPGQQVVSRRGAMLAYTGRVTFSPAQAGLGGAPGAGGSLVGAAGRAMAGEHVPLMVADGAGEVFYGHRGLHVTLVRLDGTQVLSVESDRLLAHDASLSPSVVFLGQQGGIRSAIRGAVTGQGLFTTQLAGAGDVAVLAHGGTIAIEVRADKQVVVDPQAYVAHTGQVNLAVSVSAGWREAVGRGSGEAVQLKATGQGTLYVQASEQKL